MIRVDIPNIYSVPTPDRIFCKLLDDAVEQAVALDAASIVLNLFWAPDQHDLHRQCVENIARIKPQCERWGMPMMVEPMLLIPDEKGGYKVNPDIQKTIALARQSVELGADIVKADLAERTRRIPSGGGSGGAQTAAAPRRRPGFRHGNSYSNPFADPARGFRRGLRSQHLSALPPAADGPRLPRGGS